MFTSFKIFVVAGLAWMFIQPTENLSTKNSSELQDSVLLTYPEEVMAIIDNKCMGCHKPDAKSEKAREKLQWVKLPDMEKSELVGILDEILEVLEEGSMPPEKMLERFPDKKLTEDEVAVLTKWADNTVNRLIGE